MLDCMVKDQSFLYIVAKVDEYWFLIIWRFRKDFLNTLIIDIFEIRWRYIPYIQYPSKQQQQHQQFHVDEPTSSNVVEVPAPVVVKLPGDEPLPTTSIVVSHPQPLVSGIYLLFFSILKSVFDWFVHSAPSLLSDPFDFFNMMMMPDVSLDDIDWLNIASEENIRPRKRQNIITISRTFSFANSFFL